MAFDKVQDSGKRQEFNTGSVRDTNEGKPRYDLIPPISLYRLAMHFANGAKKYGDRNWEKGQPLSRYIESLERHLQKAKVGLLDEDHWSAIVWNAMAFIHTQTMIQTGELPDTLNDLPHYSIEIQNILLGKSQVEQNKLKAKDMVQKVSMEMDATQPKTTVDIRVSEEN